MKKFFVFVALTTIILAISACGTTSSNSSTPAIEVNSPWVRMVDGMSGMGGANATGALYMIIKNNSDKADKLFKVETDAAGMAQIHLSAVDANGVASMNEVDNIAIPAGGTIELKSGGHHVMLMNLKRDLKVGDTVTFTLTFQNAGVLTIAAPVKEP